MQQQPPHPQMSDLAFNYGKADVSNTPIFTNKSGLTPLERPKFDAIDMNDFGENYNVSLLEEYQKRHLYGFTSAELAQLEATTLVDVDIKPNNLENTIHPLFSRDRWLVGESHFFSDTLQQNPRYEATDDVVWEALQPSLKLASRILSHPSCYIFFSSLWRSEMADYKLIDRSKYPEAEFKNNDPLHTFELMPFYDLEQEDPQFSVFMERMTQPDAVPHSSRIELGFTAKKENPTKGHGGRSANTAGLTCPPQYHPEFPEKEKVTGLYLAHEILSPLLDMNMSDADTLLQQSYIAMTLVHELAHAFFNDIRALWYPFHEDSDEDMTDDEDEDDDDDEPFVNKYLDWEDYGKIQFLEPYFGEETLAELGYVLENILYNGALWPIITERSGRTHPTGGMLSFSWPCPALTTLSLPLAPSSLPPSVASPVPISFFERINQEDFWIDAAGKYVDQVLKLPTLAYGRIDVENKGKFHRTTIPPEAEWIRDDVFSRIAFLRSEDNTAAVLVNLDDIVTNIKLLDRVVTLYHQSVQSEQSVFDIFTQYVKLVLESLSDDTAEERAAIRAQCWENFERILDLECVNFSRHNSRLALRMQAKLYTRSQMVERHRMLEHIVYFFKLICTNNVETDIINDLNKKIYRLKEILMYQTPQEAARTGPREKEDRIHADVISATMLDIVRLDLLEWAFEDLNSLLSDRDESNRLNDVNHAKATMLACHCNKLPERARRLYGDYAMDFMASKKELASKFAGFLEIMKISIYLNPDYQLSVAGDQMPNWEMRPFVPIPKRPRDESSEEDDYDDDDDDSDDNDPSRKRIKTAADPLNIVESPVVSTSAGASTSAVHSSSTATLTSTAAPTTTAAASSKSAVLPHRVKLDPSRSAGPAAFAGASTSAGPSTSTGHATSTRPSTSIGPSTSTATTSSNPSGLPTREKPGPRRSEREKRKPQRY